MRRQRPLVVYVLFTCLVFAGCSGSSSDENYRFVLDPESTLPFAATGVTTKVSYCPDERTDNRARIVVSTGRTGSGDGFELEASPSLYILVQDAVPDPTATHRLTGVTPLDRISIELQKTFGKSSVVVGLSQGTGAMACNGRCPGAPDPYAVVDATLRFPRFGFHHGDSLVVDFDFLLESGQRLAGRVEAQLQVERLEECAEAL